MKRLNLSIFYLVLTTILLLIGVTCATGQTMSRTNNLIYDESLTEEQRVIIADASEILNIGHTSIIIAHNSASVTDEHMFLHKTNGEKLGNTYTILCGKSKSSLLLQSMKALARVWLDRKGYEAPTNAQVLKVVQVVTEELNK